MDQKEQLDLERTDEDTTNILLEYIAAKEPQTLGSTSESKQTSKNTSRTRTESVEKALALIDRSKLHCKQKEVVFTETESEGFVVLSTSECPVPRMSTVNTACNPAPRPSTLALQAATDPEDPPLFSPCSSCPNPSLHASQSSPTLPVQARCSAMSIPQQSRAQCLPVVSAI